MKRLMLFTVFSFGFSSATAQASTYHVQGAIDPALSVWGNSYFEATNKIPFVCGEYETEMTLS